MLHLYKLRALILSALFVVPTAVAADLQGKVVSIADGDTLTILDATHIQHKIRLAGIDAPEKSQPFGTQSKQSLSGCAYGKQASIQGDKVDRYQRRIGKVIVGCVLRSNLPPQTIQNPPPVTMQNRPATPIANPPLHQRHRRHLSAMNSQ